MAGLERSDRGAVRRLTLNGPRRATRSISHCFRRCARNWPPPQRPTPVSGCLILAGAGKGFCASADVREWSALAAAGNDRPKGRDWVAEAHRLVAELAEFRARPSR